MIARLRQSLSRPFRLVDRFMIDGAVNGVAIALMLIGEALRHFGRGRLQIQWLVMVAVLVALSIWIVLRVPDTVLGMGSALWRR